MSVNVPLLLLASAMWAIMAWWAGLRRGRRQAYLEWHEWFTELVRGEHPDVRWEDSVYGATRRSFGPRGGPMDRYLKS